MPLGQLNNPELTNHTSHAVLIIFGLNGSLCFYFSIQKNTVCVSMSQRDKNPYKNVIKIQRFNFCYSNEIQKRKPESKTI